jgi:NADPH:quinone reductase-like Zn-dependent oxidoreductase
MGSSPADLDCPAHPGESFTARTLRLRVRAVKSEPVARSKPMASAESLEPGLPAVNAGMLLVRIEAVNPLPPSDSDDKADFAHGRYAAPPFGIAGKVEAMAGGVSGFSVGDSVFGVASRRPLSGTDQFLVVEACRMARMPSRVDFIEAASIALVGTSAWQMLFQVGRIDAGETVLILGADTPIGAFAAQLAMLYGVRTIALISAAGVEREVLLHGAHRVIDASLGQLEAECSVASLVVDTIGGAPRKRATRSLRSGCTLVSCVEGFDVCNSARPGSRSLFHVPESTTYSLALIATLVDAAHVTTRPPGSVPGND